MTREEAIEFGKRVLSLTPFDELREFCEIAVKSLEQESCNDCVSRQVVLDIAKSSKSNWIDNSVLFKRVNNLPPVTPQPKMGRWIFTQRDKCIEISCSECGNIRFRDYAGISRGYTTYELNHDKINDLLIEFRMNYCECCGAKMQEVKE